MTSFSFTVTINTRAVNFKRYLVLQDMSDEQQLLLFVDTEGNPTQELAAICFDVINLCVKDVYLQYAKPLPGPEDMDWFARRHVHGLNRAYLEQHGFDTEEGLVADFHTWRQKHCINEIYAHAPEKEKRLLNIPITDVHLPSWSERSKLACHRKAMRMKLMSEPIVDTFCIPSLVHAEYRGWPKHHSEGDFARQEFGVHCALFDCVAILCHLFPDASLLSTKGACS